MIRTSNLALSFIGAYSQHAYAVSDWILFSMRHRVSTPTYPHYLWFLIPKTQSFHLQPRAPFVHPLFTCRPMVIARRNTLGHLYLTSEPIAAFPRYFVELSSPRFVLRPTQISSTSRLPSLVCHPKRLSSSRCFRPPLASLFRSDYYRPKRQYPTDIRPSEPLLVNATHRIHVPVSPAMRCRFRNGCLDSTYQFYFSATT